VATVASYLIDRLASLGARHLFGVPGNYTAQFLAAVRQDGRMRYVGTTNELEAGYAADALSRSERLGVACVTYGVGSFSLYNAIAGAFVERCPVVLVNGTANADKRDQFLRQGVLFAHAIDPLRTDEAIFRPITAATAVIIDPRDAPAQIDQALRACLFESQPVYIEVPDRVWVLECADPADPPAGQPLAVPPPAPGVAADIAQATAAAVKEVVARAREASHPVLWGGEWLQRLRLGPLFGELVEQTNWSYTTTLLGKALISEQNPHFIGVYDSAFARAAVRDVVEKTDCLIALGTILSDFYGPIVGKKFDRMILAAARSVRVGPAVYPHVPLADFVRGLRDAFRPGVLPAQTPPAGFDQLRAEAGSRRQPAAAAAGLAGAVPAVTWDSFFVVMRARTWKGWRVLVDTGAALFPASELFIEEPDHFIAQTAWLSIGFTTGGALGASFAADGARVAAFAGDGGFQMLPQVLSTLARAKKPAVVFVFANGLYAIEQYLIDKTYFGASPPPAQFFNELPVWDYVKLAEAFGARGFRVATDGELRQALTAIDGLKDQPALVAVDLDPRDLPEELKATIPAAGPAALAGPAAAVPTVNLAAFN
jgi:indolepyruvate decarboxylase